MEIDNSTNKVSTDNPLLGVANFLAAAYNGRFSKDGSKLEGADKAQAAWANFQGPNFQGLGDLPGRA